MMVLVLTGVPVVAMMMIMFIRMAISMMVMLAFHAVGLRRLVRTASLGVMIGERPDSQDGAQHACCHQRRDAWSTVSAIHAYPH